MRLIERFRNLIETNRYAGRAYAWLGLIPGYSGFVHRRASKRIAYVNRERCYSLMIETSAVCNAKCSFCPYPNSNRKSEIMSEETFDLIVNRLVSERIQPPTIDLFDVGEPLLDRDLFNRIRKLKAVFPQAKIRITSNFSIASESMIDDVFSSGLDSIHISLNAATPESYKKIMGLNYEKTAGNVHRLIEKRNSLQSPLYILLSFVICTENKGQEAAFNALWKDKVDSICFQRSTDWMGEVDVPSSYTDAGRLYPCNEIFERIVIRSNGDLALCCQDNRDIARPNVKDRPILEIFHSEMFTAVRNRLLKGQIESLAMCRNCFAVRSNGANWIFQKYQ